MTLTPEEAIRWLDEYSANPQHPRPPWYEIACTLRAEVDRLPGALAERARIIAALRDVAENEYVRVDQPFAAERAYCSSKFRALADWLERQT